MQNREAQLWGKLPEWTATTKCRHKNPPHCCKGCILDCCSVLFCGDLYPIIVQLNSASCSLSNPKRTTWRKTVVDVVVVVSQWLSCFCRSSCGLLSLFLVLVSLLSLFFLFSFLFFLLFSSFFSFFFSFLFFSPFSLLLLPLILPLLLSILLPLLPSSPSSSPFSSSSSSPASPSSSSFSLSKFFVLLAAVAGALLVSVLLSSSFQPK